MIARKYGLRPEPAGPPRRQLAQLLRAQDIVVPDEYVIAPPASIHVYEQGRCGSCCGEAIAGAIRTYLLGQGIVDPPDPSKRFLYKVGRDKIGLGGIDDGTYPSAVFDATDEVGWATDGHMPWADGRALDEDDARRDAWVCEPVPPSVWRHAHDQKGTVLDYDVPRDVQTIKATLATGHPIVMAGDVTTAFEQYICPSALRVLEMTGEVVGGHATYLVGFLPDGGIGVNSWSRAWGFGGFFLLAWPDVLRMDLRAIRYARRASS